MTRVLRPGARLRLPRDLEVAYFIGRLGVVRIREAWPLFWGSPHTARTGFGRLVRLGLVRSFSRLAPSLPKWFSLTREGVDWVIEESGCAAEELRAPSGIARINLSALVVRNGLWSSLILASRSSKRARLTLFRPEHELRQLSADGRIPIVPDALFVVEDRETALRVAWMMEIDLGSERLSEWEKKSRTYEAMLRRRALFEEERWAVLVVVLGSRRALTISQAVVRAGAGAFTFIAEATSLLDGKAFDPVLRRALDIAEGQRSETLYSLVGGGTAANKLGRA